MSQEDVHTRHLAELGFLADIVRDMGLTAQLVERSEQVPYHTLLVDLEPDAEERPRHMAVNFYPADPELVPDTLLLQYFIVLPVMIDKAGAARLREWLPEVNNQVVLGHFSLSTGQPQQLHYRYVQALPSDSVISAEAVSDVITLVGYTPLLYQNSLEALADGDITVERARANLAEQLNEPK
jgi:hypothetical protein